ncbi:MAG: VCBS repeat-containing protein [Planctomycetia bacterium]|nr:VCBS repeat-containing protein [Planctomycetia bacterium]
MRRLKMSLTGLTTLLGLINDRCAAEMPRFEVHPIAAWGNELGQTSLADVDRDGDLDWIVGQHGEMRWYEFRNPKEWIAHEIGAGAKTDVGGTAFDVDGDGWVDQVAGTAWYRNPGNPRDARFEFFQNGAISCHDNVAADLNGDGRLDVVALSNDAAHPILAWYEIPANPRDRWQQRLIGDGIHGGVDPRGVSDLDGDGDQDVVRGNAWFENHDGRGKSWHEHAAFELPGGGRTGPFGLCLKTWVIDLDGDQDLDVVESEADFEDCRVFWFENEGRAKSWTYHPVTAEHTGQDFHALAVADFDGDGDADISSGSGPLTKAAQQRAFIWENRNGHGGAWTEHVICEGIPSHETKAADVDQDGDVDLCTKPWQGNQHYFLRNRLRDPPPAKDQ